MNKLENFYKQIIENVLINKSISSPLNILYALLTLSKVTNKEAANEILNVLNISEVESNELLKDIKSYVNVNSSIWINNKANIKDCINSDYYELFIKDFNNNISKDIINWINDKTNNLFKGVSIDVKKDSVIEIFNTLYIKEKWVTPFSRKNTRKKEFYIDKDNKVICNFMNRKDDDDIYLGNTYTCMSIHFEDQSCINFVLPKNSIEDVYKDPDLYKLIFNELKGINKDFGHINISIPRLELTNKNDLSIDIRRLGIKQLFKDNKQVFKLVNDDTKVNEINELDILKLNEDGIEAASVIETSVGFAGLYDDPLKNYDFKLNKPFIFSYLKNNIPVFVGVVNNPLN